MGPALSGFRCPDKTNLGPHRPPAPWPFRQQQNTEHEDVGVGVGVIHGVSSKGGEIQTILELDLNGPWPIPISSFRLVPPFSCQFPRKAKPRLWPDDVFGRRRRCFGCKSQLGELAPVTSAVYGSLLLGGGLFAYGRAGSKGSLAGGCTGAVLMGAAYYLMQIPETRQIGYALGFGSSFLFASVFGIRLAATRKLAPAGPLLGLSVLAFGCVHISLFTRQNMIIPWCLPE